MAPHNDGRDQLGLGAPPAGRQAGRQAGSRRQGGRIRATERVGGQRQVWLNKRGLGSSASHTPTTARQLPHVQRRRLLGGAAAGCMMMLSEGLHAAAARTLQTRSARIRSRRGRTRLLWGLVPWALGGCRSAASQGLEASPARSCAAPPHTRCAPPAAAGGPCPASGPAQAAAAAGGRR